MKKAACAIGIVAAGALWRMGLVRYRTTRPTWKLALQYKANINSISDKRQGGLMSHDVAISQIESERDRLFRLLDRLWWVDRLRMRLWIWFVDDMIELLKQGSVRNYRLEQVG